MSDSLITFDNLQHYDSEIKKHIANELGDKLDKSVYDNHLNSASHYLSDMIQSDTAKYTTQAEINRLQGFRRCETMENVSGTVQLMTNNFDMFYLVLSGAVTNMQLIDTATDAAVVNNNSTLARHIKIIVKNPSAGINWPSSVVWMNGEAPSYTSGYTNADVDVFDLFTPDGVTWFGHYMQKWTI